MPREAWCVFFFNLLLLLHGPPLPDLFSIPFFFFLFIFLFLFFFATLFFLPPLPFLQILVVWLQKKHPLGFAWH
jgi:hypothetical protein